jgi:hypothetical protein
MNIGEKETDLPINLPIPADPAQAPIHEPTPAVEPAQAPEKVGAMADPDEMVWAYLDGGR